MQPRMSNPAMVIPEAWQAILALKTATEQGGVPPATLDLVHLRVSQINGCTFCVDKGTCRAMEAGETDERILAVATWRQAPCFTAAECAALALAESATRISDRADPVPDEVWAAAARHYDERALAALILRIAATNLFNRLFVAIRQEAGTGSAPPVPTERLAVTA